VQYGANYISGWCIKFFPYIENRGRVSVTRDSLGNVRYNDHDEVSFSPNPFMKGNSYLISTLNSSSIPNSVLHVDVTWNDYYHDTTKFVQLVSGFVGMKQYEDKSLEPFISWAVLDNLPLNYAERHEFKRNKATRNFDPHKFWSPSNYHHEYLKSQVEYTGSNWSEIELELNKVQQREDKADTLDFWVLSDSTTLIDSYTGDSSHLAKFDSILKTTDGNWKPATALVSDVYFFNYSDEMDTTVTFNTNTLKRIILK